MGSKYNAELSKYPYKGYYDNSISSQKLLQFLFKLIKAYFDYEIIDVHIRKNKKV